MYPATFVTPLWQTMWYLSEQHNSRLCSHRRRRRSLGPPATSGSTRTYRESIIFPQLQNPCAATANTSVKCSVWRGAGMRWRSWGQQAKADEGHCGPKVRRPGTRRAKRPRDVMKMAQRGGRGWDPSAAVCRWKKQIKATASIVARQCRQRPNTTCGGSWKCASHSLRGGMSVFTKEKRNRPIGTLFLLLFLYNACNWIKKISITQYL